MTERRVPYVEINGASASYEDLHQTVFRSYGHFTAMQVRDAAVRGWALHAARLTAAHREMFDRAFDVDRVHGHIRHALGLDAADVIHDASVRVYAYTPAEDGDLIAVVVRPPAEAADHPVRLMPVGYSRAVAHIKHLGDFGQTFYGAAAAKAGFDDALLVAPDGRITETAIANIGFFDGEAVVWPQAPMLDGITQQLIRAHLAAQGLGATTRPVRIADLPGLAASGAAFICNARGLAPVRSIDEVEFRVHDGLVQQLQDAYDAAPWDRF